MPNYDGAQVMDSVLPPKRSVSSCRRSSRMWAAQDGTGSGVTCGLPMEVTAPAPRRGKRGVPMEWAAPARRRRHVSDYKSRLVMVEQCARCDVTKTDLIRLRVA